MVYRKAVEYLFDLQKFGMKLGLDNISELCRKLGDPHRKFRSIHIAGSNGKGSVAHMIDAALRADGKRVGRYTSPHLQTFRERIVVDGEMISEQEVLHLVEKIKPEAESMENTPTFFEFTTAMAFKYFADRKVDIGVIEVGLGGRLDSTNILEPDVSVITSISLEHTDVLGDDIATIAWEKAGIIKQGSKVVMGKLPDVARARIVGICGERYASLASYRDPEIGDRTIDKQFVRLKTERGTYDLKIPLIGDHQAVNAAVAIAALEELRAPPAIGTIVEGLGSVVIPGRLEIVSRDPLIILDGAHNPDGAATNRRALDNVLGDRAPVYVLGIMADKDIDGILKSLVPGAKAVVATRPEYHRSADAERIGDLASRYCENVEVIVPVAEAVERGRNILGENDVLIITGSFFTAGEARQVFHPVDSLI
jgi:dihydrofolate synthase/folylpolyglutamate synthase